MNALMICGICVISVGIEGTAGIYFHADLADLADFLFRYHRGAFSTINSKRLISALRPAHKNITFAASTLKQKSYA